MRLILVAPGILVVTCPACPYRASGYQPVGVVEAMKAHETLVHGVGVSLETHALLRQAYDGPGHPASRRANPLGGPMGGGEG